MKCLLAFWMLIFGNSTSDFFHPRVEKHLSFSAMRIKPVRITSFTAVYNPSQRTVNLRWVTASEADNERFVIERSLDSLHFENIGETQSAGNSNSTQYYYFDDNRSPSGKLYYRLRQQDNNGKEYVSTVISAYKPITQLELTDIHFAPEKLEVSFAIISPKASAAGIILADISGKVLRSFYTTLPQGASFKNIYVGDLQAGIYFLQVNDRNGGGSAIKKFTKQ